MTGPSLASILDTIAIQYGPDCVRSARVYIETDAHPCAVAKTALTALRVHLGLTHEAAGEVWDDAVARTNEARQSAGARTIR